MDPNKQKLIVVNVAGSGAFHAFPVTKIHDDAGTAKYPVKFGGAPEPYASNAIGLPELPGEGGVRLSFQTSLRRNRIESPGRNICALTCPIVCHAAAEEVPLFASLPSLALT